MINLDIKLISKQLFPTKEELFTTNSKKTFCINFDISKAECPYNKITFKKDPGKEEFLSELVDTQYENIKQSSIPSELLQNFYNSNKHFYLGLSKQELKTYTLTESAKERFKITSCPVANLKVENLPLIYTSKIYYPNVEFGMSGE